MSYKFDSLITILNKLDKGEHATVQSLMDDLEMSERTVHRYIKTLQIAGFPIGFNRARQTYAFDEGYSLRKLNLTIEETLSFSLAKSMLGSFGSGMSKGLAGIEEKLSKKTTNLPPHIILSAETASQGQEYLGIIHQAISSFQRIEIDYKTLYSDEQTLRQVDPYYLFFQDGFWNLRGYCNLREEFRTFALDRILNLKVLDAHFLPRKVAPADELSGSFGSVIDGEPLDVVLRFDAEIKPHILRKKWHQSQQGKELKDGRIEVRFHVNGIEGIKQWIYRWIPYVEVVEPKELRREISNELSSALKRNS
ncbi:MAG: transcriptional regulator [Nitrospirae bacterium]|nr:transcriptional regulator [Nitrospirota bacterium]